MEDFDFHKLQELYAMQGKNFVSIYMPTQHAVEMISKDPLRLKNLTNNAKKELLRRGMASLAVEKTLKPALELINDITFWQKQGRGLALFLNEDFNRIYRFTDRFEEMMIVNSRFYIKPLLQYFNGNGKFYVLALSRKEVRLLRCDKSNCEVVDIPNVPKNIDEALGKERLTTTSQGVTTGVGRQGQERIVHVQSSVKDLDLDRMKRYVNVIDKALHRYLRNDPRLLVLAATSEYLPVYLEQSEYKNIYHKALTGNYDGISPQEIHKKALNLVKPYFMKEIDEVLQKYENIKGTPLCVDDLSKLAEAAFEGRVDTLIAAKNINRWGKFDSLSARLELHSSFKQGDEDLVDFVCVETLKNHGRVYVVDQEYLPRDIRDAAGILRF